jgi:hypothetical protein
MYLSSPYVLHSPPIMSSFFIALIKAIYTINWTWKKLVKCYIWSTALYSAEPRTLPKVDQKYMASFEMRCRRRIEKIGWTDRVRNEEVLHRVKEERNILQTI